ncbi:hypothetical protein Patl1_34385 [Pistacia atlantica]|uniref:Uncharacterized protein n=1 Tax=Pistacia atlantica TaxID=434234 RepID=A0ACC0ZS97_9ROSI|nr:hypothetical protein Patl1_34385 [Pistacia atlantica]
MTSGSRFRFVHLRIVGKEHARIPIPQCSVLNVNAIPGWKKIQIDCALVWCGKGTCVANETGYTCQCSQGAANLFGNPAWACLDICSFGADCEGLGLGLPTPNPPPSPVKSGSTTETGPAPASNCARNLRAFTMMLFATVTLAWF